MDHVYTFENDRMRNEDEEESRSQLQSSGNAYASTDRDSQHEEAHNWPKKPTTQMKELDLDEKIDHDERNANDGHAKARCAETSKSNRRNSWFGKLLSVFQNIGKKKKYQQPSDYGDTD
eukprot:CAMPEP_0202695534 /NCGR_PEP_ID=MMETSP1385-20130828/9113_1 /ASSEMBLY_ACC=CAM_ASM_000861 /TAXON_ID=933848 /ORGANISM="Elphidium margaritaceum" /LENGTH=118 /DNA_ID=CAMNT_0049351581 /DNA_START=116 /DNA_END=469 /DNA_ORIENTATION=-